MPIEEIVKSLQTAFGELPTSEFRETTRLVVPEESLYEILRTLKEEHGFDLLVDVTCVDYLNYPARTIASGWFISWPIRKPPGG